MSLRSTADKKGFFWHVVPALLYAIVIFWLGSIHTTLSIPQDFIARDKLNHFVAFGVLTVLALRALRFEMDTTALRVLITASIGISSITGALLELWQSWLPYRTAEVGDWIADTFGAALAGLLCFLWIRWRRRHVATG